LRDIDMTFCDRLSYEDALTLREEFAANHDEEEEATLVIRRQPVWADGHFQTPFANDGCHTYWPDGTFNYERERCSKGFVQKMQMIHNNPYHVKTTIQYTDFDPPVGWPEWTRFFYRPGVSLLYRKEQNNDEKHRSILVAQHIRGLVAPDDWPKPEHWSLPLSQSVHFTREGDRIEERDADAEQYVMVTRIPVLPLSDEEPAFPPPPTHLLEKNREFLQEYRDFQLQEFGGERLMTDEEDRNRVAWLHQVLGGDPL